MIDPAFLDELDQFDTAIKREIASQYQGEQESPSVGEGLTFSDYRRYAPGDDTRLIDWRVYARTEEYFIKQFEEERNLTLHVLVDGSASMDFGDGEANKFEYGAKLGLGFAYLIAEENNDFRVSVFTDEHDRLDGGRSNRGELLALIDRLNGYELGGETEFASALEAYATTIHSRSLVLVVSDFLADPDDVETGLTALARNDLLCAHVVAPAERDPDAVGDTIFEDRETATTRRSYFGGAVARNYRDRLQNHVETVADRIETLGGTHTVVDTGADFFDSFASLWVG